MFRAKTVEKIKICILGSVPSPPLHPENCAVYEIMWENTVERGRPHMTIWRTSVACWITKTTTTYSKYVTLIAFPLQQQMQERASMLRYTYSAACLVISNALKGSSGHRDRPRVTSFV